MGGPEGATERGGGQGEMEVRQLLLGSEVQPLSGRIVEAEGVSQHCPFSLTCLVISVQALPTLPLAVLASQRPGRAVEL